MNANDISGRAFKPRHGCVGLSEEKEFTASFPWLANLSTIFFGGEGFEALSKVNLIIKRCYKANKLISF